MPLERVSGAVPRKLSKPFGIPSLSGSALLITNEMGYDLGQVQGSGYWCYQGKTLRDLVAEK